jgi:hypothetical protein
LAGASAAGPGWSFFFRRFLAADPQDVEAVFARKRMGWVSTNAKARTHLRRLWRHGDPPPPRQMVRPRTGFGALYAGAGETLAAVRIRPDPGGGLRIVTDRREINAGAVYSTIPIPIALRLCGLPAAPELQARALFCHFFSFAGHRGFDQNVLYNFGAHGAWKRLTMLSDFYAEADGRMFFTAETVADASAAEGSARALTPVGRAFVDHVRRVGLFDGDLRLEGELVVENAYPVYLTGATAAANAAILRLREFGVR